MVNLAFAVYDKQGNLLLGPVDTGTLWADFPVEDCTDPSGDPIVLYDQFADRWLLSQFSTRGNPFYYDCVAISQTPDPTGAYYRYAFVTQEDTHVPGTYYFPDYPKYGVWKNSYILTTRDFGDGGGYGISVYALEKNKMVNGQAKARAVQFFLDSDVIPLELMGDGLLPPDVDGKTKPKSDAPAPIVGTQDDDYPYGATFDALNIWELKVLWNSKPDASLNFAAQLPVAEFDSNFPCGTVPRLHSAARDHKSRSVSWISCPTDSALPTVSHTAISEPMRPLSPTNPLRQRPGLAGVRWYEIRRVNGVYSLYQQGTYAPDDGVHRWMGSIARTRKATWRWVTVCERRGCLPRHPLRRTHLRRPARPDGSGEGTIVNGSGVQTTTNSRWGDYTSMNVDPVDDCTFWYVNEYYEVSGLPLPLPPPPLPPPGTTAPWQTRIASFRLPGCK